ncbi:MAG: efflux RND transporter periplasmic adaptor subunit [Nitrospira sp.]|nr:efflux RND transporter periplasmic adaptor subunit [Nitrospira sp.]
MYLKKYSGLSKSVIAGVMVLFTVLMTLLLICSCGKSGQPVKSGAFPVTVGMVIQKTVPVQIRAIGNVEAYSTVSVKSQIGGELLCIHFKEGQDVKRGDILFIKANADNPMVVINQIQPIYVTFSVPEQNLQEIKKYIAVRKLSVQALIPGDENSPVQGIITFVDNTVDISTGTIKLKGTFENKGKRLWPGQFVNVVLTLTTQPDAIVVPSHAVQTGQQGLYVFVVKSDLTVESRPVVIGRTMNGEVVIEKGLAPGEQVVTDGQLRLVPGAKVEIKGTSESSEGKQS